MTASDKRNENYNERSALRTETLRRLKTQLEEYLPDKEITSSFWAFCQVADITKLDNLATSLGNPRMQVAASLIIHNCQDAIARCQFLSLRSLSKTLRLISSLGLQILSIRGSSQSGSSRKTNRSTMAAKQVRDLTNPHVVFSNVE